MAKKFTPGIPDGFSLNVGPVQDLGDYLDEPPPTPRPQRRAVEAPPAVPVTAAVENVRAFEAAPSSPPPVVPPVSVAESPNTIAAAVPSVPQANIAPASPPVAANEEDRGGRPKAPRREISMTPETLRMSDDLLDIIRNGSGQRDTKANELFHALVLLVHEVKDDLDAHSIPKRGRWGTPTARAYPRELKNAFLRALLRKYAEGEGRTIELRFPVDSAA
jgi:hypothetical protein